MFDHDNRVPEVDEFSKVIDKETTIPRMKTYGWLIENIGDSFQFGSYLCREADTLRLSS